MMITTVHLDRHGYVMEVFQNTMAATLDAGKYTGTLMEVTGPIAPGMRWNGQTFVSPPPRIPPGAVLDEKARRSAMFPERLVKLITSIGGDNAMKVSKYLGELHNVAEGMMLSEPPADFKDDKYWPRVPELHDLPVARPVHEMQSLSPVSGQPINIHVAPVINTSAPEPKAIEIRTVSESVPSVSDDDIAKTFGLDQSDPLFKLKLIFVKGVADAVKEHGPLIPEEIRAEWQDRLAEMAAEATAATSAAKLDEQGVRVEAFLRGAA